VRGARTPARQGGEVSASGWTGIENPLCVALDGTDPVSLEALGTATAPHAGLLRIGLSGFVAGGRPLAQALAALRPLFLDLKCHDIPRQVSATVEGAAELGASYLTVHAAGGAAMLAAARGAAPPGLRLLAVTVLTSLEDVDLPSVGVPAGASTQVLRLSELALEAGIDGLVVSPLEIPAVRRRFGERASGGPLLVVPGIRAHAGGDDQRRTLPAREAIARGADIIVVGRPITASADPPEAARALLAEIGR
jgi:orotidine-5'-phosphate decarboxylase